MCWRVRLRPRGSISPAGAGSTRPCGVAEAPAKCSPCAGRGRTIYSARLFLARQHRLDAADLEDDVAVLEALDRATVHFADPLVVLGEDVFALGLTDLLEDHLFGGLRGNAPQHFGRLGELHLVAELDAV